MNTTAKTRMCLITIRTNQFSRFEFNRRKINMFIWYCMKTKLEIFFYYLHSSPDGTRSIGNVRNQTLNSESKKLIITKERLLYLLKNNTEPEFELDDIWSYDNKTRTFLKVSSNTDLVYHRKHFANRLSIFYKQRKNKSNINTRKIYIYDTPKSRNSKTKKNTNYK